MARALARLTTASATYAAPYGHLTDRSVFLRGRLAIEFGTTLKLELLGHAVEAKVAFISRDPPGAVLTFEPLEDLIALSTLEEETWADEDVTGTHDGNEAALLMKMMARAEAASDAGEHADSEDPTNTAARALDGTEVEAVPASPPAVYVDGQVFEPVAAPLRAGVQAAAEVPDAITRLRATTQVGPPDDGNED